MTSHRPSRWLGPAALLAAVAAVLFVYSTSTQDGEKSDDATVTTAQQRGGKGTSTSGEEGTSTQERTSTQPRRRTYTVRPGDTLAAIAEETGVTVEELQELNPTLDPNSLTVGDKIKLTE